MHSTNTIQAKEHTYKTKVKADCISLGSYD